MDFFFFDWRTGPNWSGGGGARSFSCLCAPGGVFALLPASLLREGEARSSVRVVVALLDLIKLWNSKIETTRESKTKQNKTRKLTTNKRKQKRKITRRKQNRQKRGKKTLFVCCGFRLLFSSKIEQNFRLFIFLEMRSETSVQLSSSPKKKKKKKKKEFFPPKISGFLNVLEKLEGRSAETKFWSILKFSSCIFALKLLVLEGVSAVSCAEKPLKLARWYLFGPVATAPTTPIGARSWGALGPKGATEACCGRGCGRSEKKRRKNENTRSKEYREWEKQTKEKHKKEF